MTVKDDEPVVLGGLIQDEDRKQRSTVPILGDIPLIGQLFSSDQKNTVTTEVVLTITPHIITEPSIPDIDVQELWSGTEATYSTKPLFQLKPDKKRKRDSETKASSTPQPDLSGSLLGGSSSASALIQPNFGSTRPEGETGEMNAGALTRL
ncbi:MAG: hypothetical protein C4293_21825, partial [Nitrospiraceae bacterium]